MSGLPSTGRLVLPEPTRSPAPEPGHALGTSERRRGSGRTTLLVGILLMTGCTLTPTDIKTGSKPWDDWPIVGKKSGDVPEPYPNPVKMAATWTPDTLVRTGHTPTRGFGGRVFFYDDKSRPVPVEGTLIVHAFDDTDPQRPVSRRYEFTPEQFTRHFSRTDLGASYSVWIPWDAVGGVQRKLSLVTSFKTAAGHLVQGSPALVMLPGPATPSATIEDTAIAANDQYRRHREAVADAGRRSMGMTTTTIARSTTSPKAAAKPSTIPVRTASMRMAELPTRRP